MARLGDPSRKLLYQGVWAAGTYRANDVVVHENNLYACVTGGTNEPPHADWLRLAGAGFGVAGAAYIKTANGAQTALVAANSAGQGARKVLIVVNVDEVFADGGGAQTVFIIGETDTTNKFVDATRLVGAAILTTFVFSGTLTEAKALLVTATAATGGGTGGITVHVVVLPFIT